jgi:HD-like signal output (HDOD) protein
LQDGTMNDLLLNRILRSPSLPAMPQVAVEVLQAEAGDDKAAAAKHLADIIDQDPRLRDRVLGAVNSPFYSLDRSCQTIVDAVNSIGLRAAKVLTVGLALVDSLMSGKTGAFSLEHWRRTVYCASAARACSRMLKTGQVEACFLSGLLMDVGMVVLADVLGEEYAQIVEQAGDHSRLESFEREELDLTHADVAGVIARYWKLPDVLQVPMANHHRPEAVSIASLKASADIASLAGLCADVFVSEDPGGAIAEVEALLQKQFQKGPAEAELLLAEIASAAEGLGPVFDMPHDAKCSLDAVRERARTRPKGAHISGRERRRAARITRQGYLSIRLYLDGVAAGPLRVKFRDASNGGIGVIHSLPMAAGAQFLVELGGGAVTRRVLYTVVRCIALGDDEFHIGARIAAEQPAGATAPLPRGAYAATTAG